MQKRIFHIESNDAVARDTFRIVLRTDGPVTVRSGQFVDIDIPGYYLRRPISVSDALPDGVVLPPSALGISVACPFSRKATQEFVVPRSMPIILAMILILR